MKGEVYVILLHKNNFYKCMRTKQVANKLYCNYYKEQWKGRMKFQIDKIL